MTAIADPLVAYFTARRQARRDRAAAGFLALGKRTQSLVREAAVMGYVLGTQAGRPASRDEFPRDMEIVLAVFSHIESCPDLYPRLAGVINRANP